MAFNPKTVFGLCNVLNRHSEHLELKFPTKDTLQYQMEQLAKRMDLIYRDSKNKWELICKNPAEVIENLISIQDYSNKLITELYKVEGSVQKQLSKDLRKGGFTKFRTQIREQFELLKVPIAEVKLFFDKGSDNIIQPDSIGAINATIHVWKFCNNKNKIPKLLSKNNVLKNFMNDCFEVFEVQEDLGAAYKNWFELNQK